MIAIEAKEVIQSMYKGEPTVLQIKALKMAYIALDKQIATVPNNVKSVKFTGSIREQFKKGDCPCCKSAVDTDDDFKFCSECGQKLDW
ncbi:hypothetical protein [uncultured Robinsoniella sp.]|uniref:hypothetical protein n=1 Tax=uncultured Robinsoniella sp. TaxID=904190 RepID=UPI00374EEBB6